MVTDVASRDHGDPGDAPSVPPPLSEIADATRPSAAEEARTIAASTNTGTLASLTSTGDPWASFVTYGLLDGRRCCACRTWPNMAATSPVIRGPALRSSRRQRRATRWQAGASPWPESPNVPPAPNWPPRVTRIWPPWTPPSTTSTTRISRCGYCGCTACAGSADTAGWIRPPAPITLRHNRSDTFAAAGAISHLNADHAESLAQMARALGGYPDTTAAACTSIDRYGLDLRVDTPRGYSYTRVGFGTPLNSADELRSAAADLAARARRG